MLEIDLTEKMRREPKERKLNRFSCSQIYYLLQGWTSLDQYINGKEFTGKDLWTMQQGTLKHEWIQSLIGEDYTVELKKELKIGDIEVVGMADLLKEGEYGIEIKTGKLKAKANRGHEFQARMYCTIFEVPYFILAQPVLVDYGKRAVLREFGRVKRNDKWFDNIIKKLHTKYEELQAYDKTNSVRGISNDRTTQGKGEPNAT